MAVDVFNEDTRKYSEKVHRLTALTPSTQLFQTAAVRKVQHHTGLTQHFLIFDIRALWRSEMSVRAPECQKLKMVG